MPGRRTANMRFRSAALVRRPRKRRRHTTPPKPLAPSRTPRPQPRRPPTRLTVHRSAHRRVKTAGGPPITVAPEGATDLRQLMSEQPRRRRRIQIQRCRDLHEPRGAQRLSASSNAAVACADAPSATRPAERRSVRELAPQRDPTEIEPRLTHTLLRAATRAAARRQPTEAPDDGYVRSQPGRSRARTQAPTLAGHTARVVHRPPGAGNSVAPALPID